MKKLLYIAVLLIGTACSAPKGTSEPTITVTIEPIRYFAEQIAGPHYRITSMVPEGSSPETYDPAPQQLMALSESEAYLRIGYIGFEQVWMERLTENAPQMQVFDLSQGVSLIREEEHAHEGHTHVGGVEPHIWSSTVNARIIAQNICDALCQLDPEHAATFTDNLSRLNRRIEQTDSTLRAMLTAGHDSIFLIYHPALSYYARDYGLQQLCIEEHGKAPSAAQLKALTDRCQREGIRTVFIQQEFDTRNARLIATEAGAQIVPINPLNYQWDEELIRITKALCHE